MWPTPCPPAISPGASRSSKSSTGRAQRRGGPPPSPSTAARSSAGTASSARAAPNSPALWLAAKPDILFIDEPTVGIDIRTKYEIHVVIRRLAESGISVVLISSDMPEIIRLADRIQVFRGGTIVGELPNSRSYDDMSRRIM